MELQLKENIKMRYKRLYYFVMNPYDKNNCYIKVQYTNGNIKYWYPKNKGFKSIYNQTIKSK